MKVLNLTPHDVNIYPVASVRMDAKTRHYFVVPGAAPDVLTIPSSGVARVSAEETAHKSARVGGVEIPQVAMTYGAITGLPEPSPGRIIIVSALVLSAGKAAGRTDLRCPARVVYDAAGHIIGCAALSM